MKRAVCLLVFLLFAGKPFAQNERTGFDVEDSNALADSGLNKDERFRDNTWFWAGYIEGLTEALQIEKSICLPDHTTRQEGQLVVMKYIKDNPTTLHEMSYVTVLRALRESYPCKK